MENYTRDFVQFEQVVNPTVKTKFLQKKSHHFSLGYRSINDRSKDFIMKFRIVSPISSQEVIEIIHGYRFSVRSEFSLNQNLEKLAGFFSFLVIESLKRVNSSLTEGEIEIPLHQSLLKAIFLMLVSRTN
jgi:hypothetical protein